mmetsp:Transcript_2935/g.3970  ORF Transcript_2935/g.3970 Transcript_2935/m.3970 type:complete len:240 (-) Transcript_2935:57-776(-)
MFTAAKSDDIIKRAEEKARAKEAPVTFVGKEGFTMLPEVSASLKILTTFDAQCINDLSLECISTLEKKGEWDSDRIHSIKEKHTILSADDLLKAVTGLYFISRAAVRDHVPLSKIKKDMISLGFKADIADVFVHHIHSNRFNIERVSMRNRIHYPRLERLKWRIDLTISSSRLKRVMVPTVTMQFFLDNGRIVNIDLSVEKFHVLRYNVAKLLLQMGTLNRHPMIRIMNQLEEEARRGM